MGYWHKDERCDSALIQLMDALCSWERDAGRNSTLILIPHSPDERIVVAEGGKALYVGLDGNLDDPTLTPGLILTQAMYIRSRERGISAPKP